MSHEPILMTSETSETSETRMPDPTMPLWSPDRYLQAARFAARAHNAQKVPGSELPYLLHVTTVAAEVMAALAREPTTRADLAVVCALLHDVIEDCGVHVEALGEEFGADIAAGVLALSKDPGLPRDQAMADSLRRIQAQPREVWMVKLADRIANLQPPPGHWKPAKIAAYRTEALAIADALGAASPHLHARLRAKIADYPHTA